MHDDAACPGLGMHDGAACPGLGMRDDAACPCSPPSCVVPLHLLSVLFEFSPLCRSLHQVCMLAVVTTLALPRSIEAIACMLVGTFEPNGFSPS